MKNREEVEALKANWLNDPIYDLATVEGFEEYHSELDKFQDEQEAKWAAKAEKSRQKRLELADSIQTPEEIEAMLSSLDRQVGDCGSAVAYAHFKIARAQVRASLLIAIQVKRVADALEEAHDLNKAINGF